MSSNFKVAILSDSMSASNPDIEFQPNHNIGHNLQHARPVAPYKVSEGERHTLVIWGKYV